MKANIIISIIGALAVLGAQDSDPDKMSHNLEQISEVILNLEGNIEVNTWSKSELLAEYEVRSSGSVFGFSNKDRREEYKLEKRVGGSILTVQAKPRAGLKAVGVVMYSETEHHVIYLPENIRLSIKSKSGKIQINGDFQKLTVENDGELVGRFRKDAISSLMCEADQRKLVINGTKKNGTYEFSGTGQGTYNITSKRIRLTIN